MKGFTLGQYYPGNSFIHRLDPRAKIILGILALCADADSCNSFKDSFENSFAFVKTCPFHPAFYFACQYFHDKRRKSSVRVLDLPRL